jgi:hypothetical protein
LYSVTKSFISCYVLFKFLFLVLVAPVPLAPPKIDFVLLFPPNDITSSLNLGISFFASI